MSRFAIYGDVSGSDDTSFLTAASFVATAEQWARITRRWERVLTRYHVSSLHMKDFASSNGEYQPWKGFEQKRSAFSFELISALAPFVCSSFSTSLDMRDYRSVDSTLGIREVVSPLALVGCSIVAKIYRWADRYKIPRGNIEFFFEDGDVGKGEFLDSCNRHYGIKPILKLKCEARAFETADLLAYETSKAAKKLRDTKGALSMADFSAAFRQLSRISASSGGIDWGVHHNPRLDELFKQILNDADVSPTIFLGEDRGSTKRIRDFRKRSRLIAQA